MQDNSFYVVSLRSPSEIAMRKVMAESRYCETVRTIRCHGNIYSFIVHISNKYVMVLTDQGRIEIHE